MLYKNIMDERAGMRRRDQNLASVLSQFKLTISSWMILSDLEHEGKNTATQLAKLLETSLAYITTTVNGLEIREYVKRAVDTKDNRKCVISITPHGKKVLGEVEACLSQLDINKRLDPITGDCNAIYCKNKAVLDYQDKETGDWLAVCKPHSISANKERMYG